jgi:hypothetical protein
MTADPMPLVGYLRELGAELERRRFAVRIDVEDPCSPTLMVVNTAVPRLKDSILAGPDAQGELWYWFSWTGPISPVEDVWGAADRVERVLAEAGRPAC